MTNIVTDIGLKIRNRGQSLYELGYRFCGKCMKFYKVIGKKCLVCGRLLRWGPRGKPGQAFKKRNGIYDKAYSMTEEIAILNSK
ncbi:MAG TPA: hypothetical protein VF220_05400 [Nitrososphaeraceae archaeon]